jgi:hypothetical protein
MASDAKPPGSRAGTSAREKAEKSEKSKVTIERPFDKWLQKQLHAMYDEIASEPLPDDLLNLIEHDAERKNEPPESSGSESK